MYILYMYTYIHISMIIAIVIVRIIITIISTKVSGKDHRGKEWQSILAIVITKKHITYVYIYICVYPSSADSPHSKHF